MISDGSVTDTISNEAKYNTFARVSYTAYPTAEAIVNLLVQLNWTTIAIVQSRNQDSISAMSAVNVLLKKFGITVSVERYADNVFEYREALDTIRNSARSINVNIFQQ